MASLGLGAAVQIAQSPSVLASVPSAPDSPSWSIVSSANTSSSQNNQLSAASCVSPTDCWAVGAYDDSSGYYQTLIEQWNGSAWTIVTSPNANTSANEYLTSVSCPTETFCMATGTDGANNTLTEDWNGTSWSVVSSPDPENANILSSVSCTSASFCMAVGTYDSTYDLLAIQWNGSSWTQDTAASVDSIAGGLNFSSVSCVDSSDCVATGNANYNPGNFTQTWTGGTWQLSSDIESTTFITGETLSCLTLSDCFAVEGGAISQWNGSSWATAYDPSGYYFSAVSCNGVGFCDAVGTTTSSTSDPVDAEMVDGSWTPLTMPDTDEVNIWPAEDMYEGLSCAEAAVCFMVGSYGDGSYDQTLTEEIYGQVEPDGGALSTLELLGLGDDSLVDDCGCGTGDPVNTWSGNFYEQVTDVNIPGRGFNLDLSRTYNSLDASVNGPFGYGWSFSYGMSLTFTDSDTVATIIDEEGSEVTFTLTGSTWTAPPRNSSTLIENANDTWTYQRWNGESFTFNSSGQLTSEVDRYGNTTVLAYSSGDLATVTDASGRQLTFTWTGSNITKVTDPAGDTVQYSYDANGNLQYVTNQVGKETQYGYNSSHDLTTIYDPNGNQVLTNTYNGSNQVTVQEDGMERYTYFTYNSPSTNVNTTKVEDPDGNYTYYTFDFGVLVQTLAGYGSGVEAATEFIHDPATLGVTVEVDPNGNQTFSSYDDNGNLLSTTNAMDDTTSYTYNGFNEPLTITDPNGNRTTNTYSASGEMKTTTTNSDETQYQYHNTSTSIEDNGTEPIGSAATTYLPNGAASRTFSMYFKTTSSDAMDLFSYGTNTTDKLFSLELNSGGSEMTFQGSSDNATFTLPYSVIDGNWHRVVLTYNGSTSVSLYLDDELVSTQTLGSALNTASSTTLYIGSDVTGTVDLWQGYMDSFEAWSGTKTSNGPSALYALGESSGPTMNDTSGNGVNGTYSSSGLTYAQTGALSAVASTAIASTGTDGLATAPAGVLPSGDAARTISFDYETTSTSSMLLYSYGVDSTDELFDVEFTDSGNEIVFEGDSDNLTFTLPYATDDGRWHQLVLIYNGSTSMSLYLDDVLVSTETLSTALNTSTTGDLTMGTAGIGASNWDGELAQFEAFSGESASGTPVAWYQFEESAGPTMFDSSPNDNNGSFGGSGLTFQETGPTPLSGMNAGLPDSMTDPNGNTTTYTYDWYGDLEAVTNPLGDTTSYTYNVDGQKTSMVTPKGNASGKTSINSTTFYSYDALGRLTAEQTPATIPDANYQFAETSGTTMVDSSQYADNGTYSSSGITLGETPAAPGSTYAVGSNGTDPVGTAPDTDLPTGTAARQVSLWYKTTSTSAMMLFYYGTASTDEQFGVELEDSGTEIKFIGDNDSFVYVLPYATDDGNWHNIELFYNGGTQMSLYLDYMKVQTATLSAALDTVLTGTLHVGAATGSASNWDGELDALEMYPLSITTYTYDADSDLLTTTQPDGTVTTMAYDVDNELCWSYVGTSSNACGSPPTGSQSYQYDSDGNVHIYTDQNGNQTTYGYNALDQQTSVENALSQTWNYTYDGLGDLLTETTPNGNTITDTYNAANELCWTYVGTTSDTCASNPTGPTGATSYGYDADGHRTSMSDGTGSSSWGYNANGWLTSYENGAGLEVEYGYDSDGNQTSITYPSGSGIVVSQAFNAADQMCWTYVGTSSNSCSSPPSGSTTYTYNADGEISGESLANGVSDSYSYDPADQLTSISDTDGATSVFSANYGYNLEGLLRSDSSQPSGVGDYQYTAKNQVCYAGSTGADTCGSPPSGSDDYSYDNAGNLTDDNGVTQSYNDGDQLCWSYVGTSSNACGSAPSGATTYAYDSDGNMKTATPSTGSASNYSYNALDEMTGYELGSGTTTTYGYDGDGMLQSETTGSTTTDYLWDESESVAPLLETKTGSSATYYVYGPTGLPLEEIFSSGGTYYYAHDALGSTRALTNSSGTVADTDTYGPYGTLSSSTGSVTNSLLYDGQLSDSESGLYYMHARWYNAATGQFLSIDPLVKQTQDPYGYTAGDPINDSDISGLSSYLFNYSYTYDLGSTGGAFTPAGVLQELTDDPNGTWPFAVDQLETGYRAVGPGAITGVGSEEGSLRAGSAYALCYGLTCNPIQVLSATSDSNSASLQFVALAGHSEGTGSTISFTSWESDGQLCFRVSGHDTFNYSGVDNSWFWDPTAGSAVHAIDAAGAAHGLWNTLAASLRSNLSNEYVPSS